MAGFEDACSSTNWVGGSSDIGVNSNWSNGLPTFTNEGTVGGAAVVNYNLSSALNSMTLTLTDSSTLGGGNLYITSSDLFVNQTAELAVSSDLRVGAASSSQITKISLTDAAGLIVNDDVFLGYNSVAEINQAGSSYFSVGGDLILGERAGGADSLYSLSGGTLEIAKSLEILRSSEFKMSGGTVVVDENFKTKGSGSLLEVSQGSLSVGNDLELDDQGAAIISGGDIDVGDDVKLKHQSTFTITGGVLQVDDKFEVKGGSDVTQSGGIIGVGNKLVLKDSGSTYTQSGGSLGVGGLEVASKAKFFQTGGATTVVGDVTVKDSEFHQSDDVSIGGDLVISKKGVWYANGGVLNVGDDLILKDSNSEFVQTNADVIVDGSLDLSKNAKYYLEGAGSLKVADAIVIDKAQNFIWKDGGTLAVHTAANVINVIGDVDTSNGAILDLMGKTEFLDVSKTIDIQDLEVSGYDLDLDAQRDITVQTGCYLLIEADTIVGASNIYFTGFTGQDGAVLIADGAIFNPLLEDVYWFESSATQVHVCWSLTPVPEPSSLMLLGMSSLALLVRRR